MLQCQQRAGSGFVLYSTGCSKMHLPPFSCVSCAEIFALRPLTQKQKDLACLLFFFNCLVFPLLVLYHYVECGQTEDIWDTR